MGLPTGLNAMPGLSLSALKLQLNTLLHVDIRALNITGHLSYQTCSRCCNDSLPMSPLSDYGFSWIFECKLDIINYLEIGWTQWRSCWINNSLLILKYIYRNTYKLLHAAATAAWFQVAGTNPTAGLVVDLRLGMGIWNIPDSKWRAQRCGPEVIPTWAGLQLRMLNIPIRICNIHLQTKYYTLQPHLICLESI